MPRTAAAAATKVKGGRLAEWTAKPKNRPRMFIPKLEPEAVSRLKKTGGTKVKDGRRLIIPKLEPEAIAQLKKTGPDRETVRVSRPRLRTAAIKILGVSPYVQHAFSEKQRKLMEDKQRAGQQSAGRKTRQPKDFEAIYEAAKHVSKEGWIGIPAPAFRNAMISACRLVGFKMTFAKLSVFVVADGLDRNEGTPLVKIKGEPRVHRMSARNESGVADIRWRPMWDPGWSAIVRVRWDEDQFSSVDVMNLMLRAGLQVGIGEGRPDSPNSNGLGWGQFEIVE